jgi:hypothetical protein
MAKMISPAGEMDVRFSRIGAEKGSLVLEGQFGVWNSKILVGPDEIGKLVRMAMKPAVFSVVLRALFRRK